MGHRRSNDDEVHKISTCIYVTNFPDQFSSKDLWRVCNKYGTVIDAFIPNRRSKSGDKKAAPEVLNKDSEIHRNPDSYSNSYSHAVKKGNQSQSMEGENKPAIVLDETCKVFWIRAKEVPGWIPDFVEEEEEDNDSDSDPKDDELETDIVDKQKYANEGGDSDVKESFLNYLW
ncbi:nucleotide-binding alpha-beta plait domain-containing protein [Tanacetum coccineum]